MLARIEERNRQTWEGHSHVFEDGTHVLGGIGIGLLLYPRVADRARALGLALIGLSVALHLYARLSKPGARAEVEARART